MTVFRKDVYYIWDGSSGSAGSKVSVIEANRGGTTAFSTAGDSANISVTPVNDAPTLDLNGAAAGTGFTATFLPRGSEVTIVGTDITILDVDQTDRADPAKQDTITQAVVKITAGAVNNREGDSPNETLTFKDGGAAVTSWSGLSITNNGSTEVTITGTANWATYQDALKKVVYNNANLAPTPGNRTLEVSITDGNVTGGSNGPLTTTATSTVAVVGVAVVDLNGSLTGANHAVTFTEGPSGKFITTEDARIDNLGGANIKVVVLTLRNPADTVNTLSAESLVLLPTTLTGITVTGSGTHTITLTATDGVTADEMNKALRNVQYKNTSDAPSVTPRVVDVTVEDITRAGVGAKSTITVAPVNDAPVISANTAHTVLEGGLLTLSTTNLNATDVDDTQATLDFVITTAPTKGVLFRDANGNNIADTGEVLTAITSPVTAGALNQFTQGDLANNLIKYKQTDTLAGSATDYGSDSFGFKVQDGMENGVSAPTGTASITITPVNDAPTLTATAGNPTFTENATSATTSAWAVLFSAASLSPVESTQFVSEVTLTVSNVSNGTHEKLRVDGQEIALENTTGTPTTTANRFGYTVVLSGTTATVSLSKASTSTADWATLLTNPDTGLAYRNTSNAPSTLDRVVTLTSVKDNGGTSTGVDTTALAIASTVTITAIDSAPVLGTNTGDTLANGALTTITAAKLATTDSDSADSALVYTVGTAPLKGTLFKDLNSSGAAEAGEALTASSTFTQADIDANLIKYRHGGTDNLADSFAFTVKDATTTLGSASFNLTISGNAPTTPTVTGSGSTTPNSTDGSDVLFTSVVVSPASGNTIKSLAFTVAGVKDGGSEKISINGQTIALTVGTTTVGDITYVVSANPDGSLKLTLTDTTNPGWDSTTASVLVNDMRYLDQQVPPSAGQRSVTLSEVTDWLAPAPGGTAGTPTPVSIGSTITLAPSTDLFSLANARDAIHPPTTPNDVITTLNFNITGAANGSNEVLKINGHEIPMTAPGSTVGGITYAVTDTGGGSFSVSVTNPAGWTEAQAEALLDGATYVNNASPATSGSRGVTLASVIEADLQQLLPSGNPTPSNTPTLITTPALTTTVNTTVGGAGSTPLNTATLPTVAPNTLDTLTFAVTGVQDGANEVLNIGGTTIPLVPGTVPSTTPPGEYVVTVVNGIATVLFTPTDNLSGTAANTLIQSTTYTNNATPATEGTRTVAVTNVGVEPSGGGAAVPTPITTISGPVTVSGVTVPTLTPGSGTDLFNGIDLPTVDSGKSVKAITLNITGVQDGAKETITINGQTIPLVDGTSVTVAGVTYVVVLDATGTGTLTITDTTAPGWNEAQAENILNNIGYQNTANPPTAGDRNINVKEVALANNADWTAATSPLTSLPTTATTPSTVTATTTATTVPSGTSSQLFASVNLPTPTSDSTVSELSFTVTGVKNGEKEIFTVNGQNIPLVPGNTTVDGVTYTVTVDASGTATITVSDSTAPGFTEAKAEAIVNGAAYTNTASPAIAGERVVSLTGMKEMTALGVQSAVTLGGAAPTPVTVNVGGTSPGVPSGSSTVDLFNGVNLSDPTPNSYKTLTFGVTGVKDGTDEVFTVNGKTVPLTNGVITDGDVTYTVTLDANGDGTVTVTDATASGFSQTDAQNMVNSATYANSASPATHGVRVITLKSTTVMDGSSVEGATTTISGISTSINPATGTTSTAPMASETLSVTDGSSVDSLTFTVSGVKDGASETLTVGGQSIPLVATPTPLGPYNDTTSGKTFTVSVTVDAAGKATVVVDTPDAPTLNFTAADAQSLVQGVVYTNSATPPTAGTREVALASMVEEIGDGSTANTQSTVTPVGIGSPVVVSGSPSADVFTNTQTIPALGGGESVDSFTVDSFTVGVAGVKDGASEIININGQKIPLVAGTTTTDPNGYTYTVAIDGNGNATVTVGTPAPLANFSRDQVNAIIDGINYTNQASPVTSGARDISVNNLVKEDGSSPPVQTTVPTPGLSSTLALGTVTNTAPTVVTNTTVPVAEGQTVTLTGSHVAATDAQQAAGSLVFKLASAPTHGAVFRDANGNGLAEAGEIIALNGTFTQQELTSGSIKYRHDSSEAASDVLQFTVSDGIATTTAMPLVFAISRVNDQPTLSATAANPTYTEATPPVPKVLYSVATATTGDTLGTAQKFTNLTLTVSNIADGASEMLLVNGTNQIELSGTTASGTAGTITTNLSYTSPFAIAEVEIINYFLYRKKPFNAKS